MGASGFCAWLTGSRHGCVSDLQGNYTARGLEIGVAYIVVGIDPYSEHKATGAGPVVDRAA